jgi:hypothetical protein
VATNEAPAFTVTLLAVTPFRQVTPVATVTLFWLVVSVVVHVGDEPGRTVAV